MGTLLQVHGQLAAGGVSQSDILNLTTKMRGALECSGTGLTNCTRLTVAAEIRLCPS
jgi:hypothetical protein